MSSLIRGMVTFLSRLRSGAIDLTNSRYERRVDEINRRYKDVSSLPDDALQRHAATIRQRVQGGTRLDDVVIDAFAIVKETASTHGRHAGLRRPASGLLALHDRKLVEMQTGEGKTLAAVLPARCACSARRPCLDVQRLPAARDAEWMGPIYRFSA